jgi:hypothetical protein
MVLFAVIFPMPHAGFNQLVKQPFVVIGKGYPYIVILKKNINGVHA